MEANKRVLEIQQILQQGDSLAANIARKYDDWRSARDSWERDKRELRNYLFATDTTTTTNSQLPWKNSTTIPKLTQIRDNLHANYMAALFPHEDWLRWEGSEQDAETREKRQVVEMYMKNKTRNSDFRQTISDLVLDYIDYGNAFAEVVYVEEHGEDHNEHETIGYVGPKVVRIPPQDIVFNLSAANFRDAPKITRYMLTVGDLRKMAKDRPEEAENIERALQQVREVRSQISGYDPTDINRAAGFQVDGFTDINRYFESGMVEILEFEGDLYDMTDDELYENHRILVADRMFVVYKDKIPNWTGKSTKVHVGWRARPDNLMAMGPLDNLVGMQYRIDHLENLKADVFDLIAHPPLKVHGNVSDFTWGPGEIIYTDEEGDVDQMGPSVDALSANMEIENLQRTMEEMAGAPRQAMGVRTPGEKTAFEVQQLENAAGRIFQNKVNHFEEQFLEPLLNSMLESARRNMGRAGDVIRVVDDELGAVQFQSITKEEITAKGKLRAIGARHFARQSQIAQELSQFMQGIGQDPAVARHMSGLTIAKMIEATLGLEDRELVREHIGLEEEFKAMEFQQMQQQEVAEQQAMPGIDPAEMAQEEAEIDAAQEAFDPSD